MLIGYARVSTEGQELQPQLDALRAAGCERVFSEKVSGATTERPQLDAALDYARAGDTLVVWKLDRLGRDMRGLVQLAADFSDRGLNLKSLTDNVDTSTAAGRFFFNIMASVAEMERELIRERTIAGVAIARANGRQLGRRNALSEEKRRLALKLFANADLTVSEIAKAVGCSVATLYRNFTAAERGRPANLGGRPPGRGRQLTLPALPTAADAVTV